MLRAEDPVIHGQQPGERVPGGGRIPRMPGPAGQVGAGGQGARVLRAEDPVIHGQQPGERVLGEDHPDTLASVNGLAADLRALGQASRAIPALTMTDSLAYRNPPWPWVLPGSCSTSFRISPWRLVSDSGSRMGAAGRAEMRSDAVARARHPAGKEDIR
jgi:hypothetical protein